MTKRTLITLLFLALVILLILASLTVFEDGSFALGSYPYPVTGCMPWGLCAR
jgi:hypothetical protein